MSASLLDSIFAALEKEATAFENATGRGLAGKEKYDERVGVSRGLRRAIDVVRDTAQAVNEDDD